MSIDVSITDPQTDDDQKRTEPGETQLSVKLNMRKGSDGSVMIFDHEDIDIVILPEKSKIVALPKDLKTDETYETQNQLFEAFPKTKTTSKYSPDNSPTIPAQYSYIK